MKRRPAAVARFALLSFLALAGCADEAGPEKSTGVVGQADLPEGEATVSAEAALSALQSVAQAPIAVRWSRFGTAQTLQGAMGVRLPSPTATNARDFLFDRAPLFGLDAAAAAELSDAARRESLIGKHFTFAQTHRGVPVHGAEVKVHINAAGDVIGVNNGFVPGLDLETAPSVSAATALKIALNAVGVSGPLQLDGAPESPALVVEVDRGAPALAWRVVVPTLGPTWELFVDAHSGALRAAAEDLNRYINGTGKVFRVNAVVATQNPALVDNRDAAAAVPAAAYSVVTLQGLTGNGKLEGTFASSAGSKTRVTSATHTFSYDRSTSGFNETMGYYYIDLAQRHLQTLGFVNVNNRQQVFSVDRLRDDNSYYSPSTKQLTFGAGGVDDAEDGEVVLHEYGHSIQDNQVPGFGATAEGGAMGEGFGDYWAASVGAQQSNGFQDTCVADWDATSYSRAQPRCLRRMDSAKRYPENFVNQVHADGEMWSATLWRIRGALGAERTDRLVIQSHFLLSSRANFADGANALVSAATNLGYAAAEVDAVRGALRDRGFAVAL